MVEIIYLRRRKQKPPPGLAGASESVQAGSENGSNNTPKSRTNQGILRLNFDRQAAQFVREQFREARSFGRVGR